MGYSPAEPLRPNIAAGRRVSLAIERGFQSSGLGSCKGNLVSWQGFRSTQQIAEPSSYLPSTLLNPKHHNAVARLKGTPNLRGQHRCRQVGCLYASLQGVQKEFPYQGCVIFEASFHGPLRRRRFEVSPLEPASLELYSYRNPIYEIGGWLTIFVFIVGL